MRRIVYFAVIAIAVTRWADAADPNPVLVDATTCLIQSSIIPSPNRFIIAVVEHTTRVQCDHSSCIETVKVVRDIANRMPNGLSSPSEFRIAAVNKALLARMSGTEQPPYRIYREIGIYLPAPGAEPDVYYGASAFSPVADELEAIYVAAAKVALISSAGAPACAKAFPSLTLPADNR